MFKGWCSGSGTAALPGKQRTATNLEYQIYNKPLFGDWFKSDNRKVYQILKSLVLKTDGWDWMKEADKTKDGRKAMQLLRNHYDGPGQVEKRKAFARQQIKEVHYKNEQSFSFEKYISVLNSAYKTLEEAGETTTESTKVEEMLTRINTNNMALTAAITSIRMDSALANNFTNAASKLSETIVKIMPAAFQQNNNRYNRRNVSDVRSGRFGRGGGRGYRGGGRDGGRGGRGGRGGYYGRGGGRGYNGRGGRGRNNHYFNRPSDWHYRTVNGVDLSDPLRDFTEQEYMQIPGDIKDAMRAYRRAFGRGARGNGGGDNNKRNLSATQQDTSSQNNQSNNSGDRGGNAGNAFGRTSYNNNNNNNNGQQDSNKRSRH